MAERNFDNRTLFHGENLDFLRGLNSETVDLVATDPPFNKGKDFHATPESLSAGAKFQDRWSWAEDVEREWIEQIKDDKPRVYSLIDHVIGGIEEDSKTRKRHGGREDLAAFLCFMGVRLIEMRRVLKDTGSIYLHCDPTASHYLKALMDAVFGDKQFRNEIIWSYRTGGASKKKFAQKHDIILFYTKSNGYSFNRMRERAYTKSKSRKPGIVDYGAGKAEFFEDEQGVYSNVVMRDVWDISYINSQSKERTGYPTQKPLALYERIIKASSNPGDVVLDPFCGCATTPIAAERLGRQWIGMDLWDGVYDIVRRRMEDNKQLLAESNPQIILRGEDDIPERTDGGDDAPIYELALQKWYPREPWQKLTHADMRQMLAEAQCSDMPGLVDCAGCGRSVEIEFMELDHINPKAQGGDNWIVNRILLCGPCNRYKSADLTIIGLHKRNKHERWMFSQAKADAALARAKMRAQRERMAA